jgi:hypothetical protein
MKEYKLKKTKLMKYIAVVGSRGYDNYDDFINKINYYTKRFKRDEITFVSGAADSGADHLISKFCKEHDLPIIEYPAQWTDIEDKKPHEIGTRRDGTKYYKAAGFDRNINIIAQADFVIAFWDGWSKGTKHSIDLAKGTGKPLRVVTVKTR